MAATLPEPTHRLPRDAVLYWRATGALQTLVALVAALAFGGSMGGVAWIALVAVLVAGVVMVGIVPPLRWRRWAYDVREDEIDLRHGTFVVKRTLVPIRRVQHVDTESGPLQDSLNLATVTFHTAAGGVSIPALGRHESETVRARVAELARTRDDT